MLPDDLFERVEAEAARHRVSRSEFYRRALCRHLGEKEENDVTRQLNELYAKTKYRVDPALSAMQSASLTDDRW